MDSMSVIIIVFLVVVAVIALPYGIAVTISTYPGKFWIKRMYKSPILDDILYLYY